MEGTVRDSTFVAYPSVIRCQAIPLLGQKRLSDLSPAHFSDAYRKLLADGRRDGEGGLSPATVRYMHVVIRQALQAAVEWGRLAENPVQVVSREPKTRAHRSIGCESDTLAALKAHRDRQRFERKLWGEAHEDHGLVFCREDGRPFRPEVVNQQFRGTPRPPACRPSGSTI